MKTQKEIEKEIEKLKDIGILKSQLKYIIDGHKGKIVNPRYVEKMVLKALLQQSKEFIEMINNIHSQTYSDCDCGDYDEGCIKCFRKQLKSSIIGSEEK